MNYKPILVGVILIVAGTAWLFLARDDQRLIVVEKFGNLLKVFQTKSSVFEEGREKAVNGEYRAAIVLLNDYLGGCPNCQESSRARFFIAKSYIGLGDLVRARVEFKTVIRDYPGSLEAHKSKYKLALIDLWEGRKEAARAEFARMAERPDGPLAPEASGMAAYLAE